MKSFRIAFVVFLLAPTLVATGCSRADTEPEQARAVTCMACHGGNGMVTVPNTPRLAGQSPVYLAKQLRAFRDGERKDPTMSPLAAGLTDDQIEGLSRYFAALDPCSVNSP